MDTDAMKLARGIVNGEIGPTNGERALVMARALCEIRPLLIAADSELSAIAHGRPPSDNETLKDLSWRLRCAYEKRKGGAA